MAKRHVTILDLIPRPYESVWVYWERLLQWAKQKDVIVVGPGARISETANGTSVVFTGGKSWQSPFKVSIFEGKVRVRPGYVGDENPTIDEVHLDGYDVEGVEKTEPRLTLPADTAPGPDGRSFVCLQMLWDVASRAPLDDEDDWLTILHVPDLAAARAEAGPGVALEPLAICYWDEDKIRETRQIVHHNLIHSFLPGEAEGTGKHFFSAV